MVIIPLWPENNYSNFTQLHHSMCFFRKSSRGKFQCSSSKPWRTPLLQQHGYQRSLTLLAFFLDCETVSIKSAAY